jgi:hypothetical protein
MEKWSGENYIGKRYNEYYILYTHNRDSGPLDESNFDSIKKILDEKKAVYEIVSFNHWLCGWVEEILIHESEKDSLIIGNDILKQLDDYPVIDEEDWSNRENDLFYESFNDWGYKDALSALADKFNLEIYDYKEEEFKALLLEKDSRGNPSWMIESGGGCYIDIDQMIEGISLEELKPLLTDYEVRV